MSQPVKHSVPCPKCGQPIEFTLWRSIDMTEPEAARIVSGDLFKLQCPACSAGTCADYPMLVNDAAHDKIIWYAAEWEKEDVKKVLASGKYAGRLRVVSSQTALREKTAIFAEGLDDRLIEILKVITLERMEKQLEDRTVGDVWYVKKDGKERFEINIDDQVGCFDLDRRVYDSLKTVLSGMLDRTPAPETVDRKWAEEFLLICGQDLTGDDSTAAPKQ